MLLERSAGSNCLRRLQGPGSVRPRHLVVNYAASSVINSLPPLTIPARGIVHNLAAPTAIPASPVLHNLLCRFELRPVFQRSRTAQGPAVTTLPQVLFHRFRCVGRIRETDVTRREIHGETCPPRPLPCLPDELGVCRRRSSTLANRSGPFFRPTVPPYPPSSVRCDRR